MALLFLVLCLVLLGVKTGYESEGTEKNVRRYAARVLEVDDSRLSLIGVTRMGSQKLKVELLQGAHKGQRMTVYNPLQSRMEVDEIYCKGDKLLVQYTPAADGALGVGTARGHYRLHLELLLVLLFVGMLLLVGGVTGLKAILSFSFAVLMIWKVMIPLFLKGHNPILVALGVVAALTAAISFLVGGLSRKGLATFSGAFLGLLLTAGLAQVFGDLFKIHGAVRPYAETLLYSGFYDLKLTPIFIASIFIASSGAVMDLAMDISAAMEEVKLKHPEIHAIEHIRSGLRVGRSVIGTMTTTLLLAYSSGFIFMFMFFVSQDIPATQVFNLNYVSAEVLNTLVGSFGLVTVAPFTALMSGLLMRGKR